MLNVLPMIQQAEDPFIRGLRVILARRPDLNPSRLAKDAGLDNSTLRKLLKGDIESLSVKNCDSVARVVGVDLSVIIALGEHPDAPEILALALKLAELGPDDLQRVQGFADVVGQPRTGDTD